MIRWGTFVLVVMAAGWAAGAGEGPQAPARPKSPAALAADARAGERLQVVARGQWTPNKGNTSDWCGPAGRGPHFHLRGRVAGGEPFKIGEGLTFTAPRDGT